MAEMHMNGDRVVRFLSKRGIQRRSLALRRMADERIEKERGPFWRSRVDR